MGKRNPKQNLFVNSHLASHFTLLFTFYLTTVNLTSENSHHTVANYIYFRIIITLTYFAKGTYEYYSQNYNILK